MVDTNLDLSEMVQFTPEFTVRMQLDALRLKATNAVYEYHNFRNIPVAEIAVLLGITEDEVRAIERDETENVTHDEACRIVSVLTKAVEDARWSTVREYKPDHGTEDWVVVDKADLMALFGATREQVDYFDCKDCRYYPVLDLAEVVATTRAWGCRDGQA